MSPGRLILPFLALGALGLLLYALWGAQPPDAPGAASAPSRAGVQPTPTGVPGRRPIERSRPAVAIVDARVDAAVPADEPISAVRLDELQASVKRFYDGLPPGWRMPEKVRVDEVLPADAIDILGVPPESLLDELSHYPMNMKTGLEIVLGMGPEADSVGVAIILPSGRRYLDVLAIVPPPEPAEPGTAGE